MLGLTCCYTFFTVIIDSFFIDRCQKSDAKRCAANLQSFFGNKDTHVNKAAVKAKCDPSEFIQILRSSFEHRTFRLIQVCQPNTMRHLWNILALLTFIILCSKTVFGVRCYKNAIDDEIDGCYYCGVHQLTSVAVNYTSLTIFHNCVMTVQTPYNLNYLNIKVNRSRVDGYETILLCDTDLCNLDVLHAPGGDACRGGLNFGLAVILVCFYLRSYVLT